MNYKNLPKGTHLFDYTDLSEDAKTQAVNEIHAIDLLTFNNELKEYKASIKTNIHFCVNNTYKLSYFTRRKNHINKTQKNLKHLENYITGNLCKFTKNGNYVSFSI